MTAHDRPLVLSLFPGIGLLDRAFEAEGFTVVRGPDLLWGGDIRSFHPPAGKFDGVIGGPPCQCFSSLSNINRVKYGESSLAPNLIPDFERVVREAWPRWFLMENVPRAPQPEVEGYCVNPVVLNNRWLGEEQARVRRFTFGADWRIAERFNMNYGEFATLLNPIHEPTACATSGGRRRTPRRDRRGNLQSAILLNRTRADLARLQGLPEDFLADAPFTEREKMRVIGNGVPLPMGRAVAQAVKRALGYELEPVA
jgi:DNA (cytosine-5)-methyltransferase 1